MTRGAAKPQPLGNGLFPTLLPICSGRTLLVIGRNSRLPYSTSSRKRHNSPFLHLELSFLFFSIEKHTNGDPHE
jgi:hypothetical protein